LCDAIRRCYYAKKEDEPEEFEEELPQGNPCEEEEYP